MIGKFILYKIYFYEGFADGRLNWISDALLHLIYNFYFNFYNIFWFSLGASWLIIMHYFFYQKKKWPFVISLFSIILVLPFVDDHSRVFSACSFMLIMIYILCNDEFLDSVSIKHLSLFFLIWILMPYSWVWQGDLRSTMFLYDLAYILDNVFGIFNNKIESSTVWPFERFK